VVLIDEYDKPIAFSRQFATLLGYTQKELESYFESYIQNLGSVLEIKKLQLLIKIKTWYNGYSWNAKDKMYNPFSILNLFMDQRFSKKLVCNWHSNVFDEVN
jgi:hypothetical protein